MVVGTGASWPLLGTVGPGGPDNELVVTVDV